MVGGLGGHHCPYQNQSDTLFDEIVLAGDGHGPAPIGSVESRGVVIVSDGTGTVSVSANAFHRGGVAIAKHHLGQTERKEQFFRIVDNVKRIIHYQTIQGEALNYADYMIQAYKGFGAQAATEVTVYTDC